MILPAVKDGIQIDSAAFYHKNGFVPLGKQCGTILARRKIQIFLYRELHGILFQTFQKVSKLCAELFGSGNTDTSKK